jgi:hypothetical protein
MEARELVKLEQVGRERAPGLEIEARLQDVERGQGAVEMIAGQRALLLLRGGQHRKRARELAEGDKDDIVGMVDPILRKAVGLTITGACETHRTILSRGCV